MVAFQHVLAFIGGATIPLSVMLFREFNPPHTAYQECLDHLKDLDQRAKETWQRSEIPDGTWIKSKTRLTHSALCNMHHGLESMPWEVESHNWHIMMDSEASVIVRDYYAGKTWVVEMRQLMRYQSAKRIRQLVVRQVVCRYAVWSPVAGKFISLGMYYDLILRVVRPRNPWSESRWSEG